VLQPECCIHCVAPKRSPSEQTGALHVGSAAGAQAQLTEPTVLTANAQGSDS
jgi:hypothetical protein